MSIRSIEEWKRVLGPLANADRAAERILGDLVSYGWHRKNRPDDVCHLANALEAWVQLSTEPGGVGILISDNE